MKFIPLILALAVLCFLFPKDVLAAKKFVKKTSSGTKKYTSSIPAIVKYRADKRAIFLSFTNFSNIKSASYSFTYNTNGNPQGAGGTITAENNPGAQRELLFGTCSTAVCTYHYNLTGARLVVTAKYANGKTASKVFRIKTYQ